MSKLSSFNEPFALLIKASAGSGKTYRLTQRILNLVRAGVAPDRILATTFTRKAAAEITSRMYKALALWYLDSSSEESRCRAEYVLSHSLQAPEVFHIATIDSLCMSIAQAFSHELGLPAQLSPAAQWRQDILDLNVLSQLLKSSDSETIALLLNQVALQQNGRSTYSVLQRYLGEGFDLFRRAAGASSMETIRAEEIIEDTLIERVEVLLSSADLPLTAKKTPDKKWENARLHVLQCLKSKSWVEILETTICSACLAGEKFNGKEFPNSLYSALLETINCARKHIVHLIAQQGEALYQLLEVYQEMHERETREQGICSFDTIKFRISQARLFESAQEFFYRLDSRFEHLLLDEFQDTSLLDWAVLEPLAEEILTSLKNGRTFFCVGDVKQSIFQWRGGLPSLFERIEEDYSAVLQTDSFDYSYRCGKNIITFVNTFFGSLRSQSLPVSASRAAENWCKRYISHSSRSSYEGYVSYTLVQSDEGSKTAILECAARHVADLASRYPEAQIGILLRGNSSSSEMLSILRSSYYRLEASEEGAAALEQSPVAQAIFALLHYLDHPDDSISLLHLHATPLAEILGISHMGTVTNTCDRVLGLRRKISDRGLGAFLVSLGRDLRDCFTVEEHIRFEQLVTLAYAFESDFGERLTEFRLFVAGETVENASASQIRVMTIHKSKGLEFDFVLLPDLDRPLQKKNGAGSFLTRVDEQTGQIVSITPFQKKVIREHIADGVLEDLYQRELIREYEEELSVLYVAFTRARQGLLMFGSSSDEPISPHKATYSHLVARAVSQIGDKRGNVVAIGEETFQVRTTAKEVLTTSARSPRQPVQRRTYDHLRIIRPVVSPSKVHEDRHHNDLFHVSLDSKRCLLLGDAVHALLKDLEWRQEGGSSEMISAPDLFSSDVATEAITLLKQAFQATGFSALFRPETFCTASELTIWRERRFAVPYNKAILNGTFDRVVLASDPRSPGIYRKAWLIDFKTTTFAADFAEDLIPRYRSQLKLYEEALRYLVEEQPNSLSVELFLALIPSGQVLSLE
jgi:ATP-dependent helicase/nuclease subunit A